MSENLSPEANQPDKRSVKVHVRISLRSGATLFFRHVDVNRAHMVAQHVCEKVSAWYTGQLKNPMLESYLSRDDFVEFQKPVPSAVRGEMTTTQGYGKAQFFSSGIHMGEIVLIAVVCPACNTVVEDSMPAHEIDNDGNCTDHMIEGTR